MGFIYHFKCSNEKCDYHINIFLGNESYADTPVDVTHIRSVATYKSYFSNNELCPKCDSRLKLDLEYEIKDKQ